MGRLKYHASFLHSFSVEMTFILSIYLFLNIHNLGTDRNHVIIFLGVVLLQYVLSHMIVWKLPVKYIYILAPVTLISLLLTGDYFLSALLISTLPVWRLEQLHYSLDETYAPQAVVGGLIWLIIINLLSTAEIDQHLNTFSIIFIASLAGYIIMRILALAMDSRYGAISYIRLTSLLILIFLAMGTLAAYLYKLLIFGLSYAVIFLLNAFVFMLRPLFDFLEDVELEYPDELFEEEEDSPDGYQSPETVMTENDQFLNVPFGAIVLSAVGIAAIFVIYSYFKKRDTIDKEERYPHQKKNVADHTRVIKTAPKKAPTERGRRLYFDFEKWAASKGHGRYTDETIEQWFRRLSLSDHTSISKLAHYQTMRYKDKELSDEELGQLKSYIKEFKDILNKKA